MNTILTREEALKRLEESKRRKRERAQEMLDAMIADYKKRTGKDPVGYEIW